MKSLTDDQREALGLSPGARIEAEGEHAPRDSGVALGFSSSSTGSGSLADLKPFLASTTRIGEFATTAGRLGGAEASVSRSDLASGVFIVAPTGLSVDVAGDAIHDRDLWVIDTRKGDVLLRLAGPSGQAVLSFEGTMFTWGRVDPMVSTELQSLASWSPPARPSLDSPGAATFLGGFDAPTWITAPLDPSLHLDAYAVVAAVGTLGRLWSPRGTATPIAAAMARVRAGDDPLSRAIRWARALSDDACVAVTEFARLEVDTLAEALATLDSEGNEDRADARNWLERRDDLASVVTLLLAVGQGNALRQWLEGLDNHARTYATTWGLLSPVASPRLEAVAWQEPDAWWATYSVAS